MSMNVEEVRSPARTALEVIHDELAFAGNETGKQVIDLLRQGNARNVKLVENNGHTFIKLPLTAAVVGAAAFTLLAPPRWTVMAMVAALFARVHVEVELVQIEMRPKSAEPEPPPEKAVRPRKATTKRTNVRAAASE